jgi:hypothetical protein
MNTFEQQVREVINGLDSEHRTAVAQSLEFSNGSPASFELELVAAHWEDPTLPVQYIMGQLEQVDQ